MKISVPIVNAFIDGESGGNPAGIVLDAERFTHAQKQTIAARVGLSETAFASPSDLAAIKLEFFTPTQQIAHCGHATVATFSYLRQQNLLSGNRSSKETIDGRRDILMEEDTAFMEQKSPRYQPLSASDLHSTLQAIGITSADLMEGAEPKVVNTGNSFILVGIRDSETIKNLRVDLDLIEELSDSLDLIGFYVFSLEGVGPGRDAGARMFAPRYGISEEAATGMAAGPLACYLYDELGIRKSDFFIEQGHWMPVPSPSVITVRLSIDKSHNIESLYAGGRGAIRDTKEIIL